MAVLTPKTKQELYEASIREVVADIQDHIIPRIQEMTDEQIRDKWFTSEYTAMLNAMRSLAHCVDKI